MKELAPVVHEAGGIVGYDASHVGTQGRVYACKGDYLVTDTVCLKDLLLKTKILPSDVHYFGWYVR